ncbi:MAG TPA: hypothetical protein VKY42_02120 [Trueperaceae bacterium]|nr:hypothetical protein [Trueperaceae bacterium]
MSVDLTQNQWVALAWAELLIVYLGYFLYLRWLERKKPKAEGEE